MRKRKITDEEFYNNIQDNKEQFYRIAYSYLGSKQDSLDAIQEVTYRSYKNLDKLKNNKYFKTWFIRILINYCIDQRKKNKKTVKLYKDFEDMSFNYIDKIEVHDIVNRLKAKYREIILLKYFEELTIREISDVLDIPEGTVKTRLSRGLNKLRKSINGGDKN